MADTFYIYLELEPWLRQWFLHENGGSAPVKLSKYTVEHRVFDTFLQKRPAGVPPEHPTDTSVAIVVPQLKYRPVASYNYLPKSALRQLCALIRNRFILKLWADLHHFGSIGKKRADLLYTWMEANGIDNTEANWNAIAKIYQRQYYNYYYRKYRSAAKKSKRNTPASKKNI